MSHTGPYFLYLITNTVTGKVYVGQTVDPTRRSYQHFNHVGSAITADLKLYGKEAIKFEFTGAQYHSFKTALAAEVELIRRYVNEGPDRCYNSLPSGGAGGVTAMHDTMP